MNKLPPPAALFEGIKEGHLRQPHQPKHANTERSMSSQMGGLAIDTNKTLPSIRALLNDYPPPDRRFSEPSMNSLVSVSSPRLQQNAGQAMSKYPYPTPANSPVEASMGGKNSTGPCRLARHWRYEESSDSARSQQGSETSETEKLRTKKERNKKAEREYCGRQQLSSWMADLQNVCLEVNPNMAILATPRPGVPNGGWRQLKSNNINKDMDNPLSVNKTDALASSITIIKDSNVLFAQIIDFLREEGKEDFARLVAESVENRGCTGFRELRICSST